MNEAAPAMPSARLHYLDVARAALLLAGIPYHAAQPFSARAWFLHSGSYSRVAELAGAFSHGFRMHAFFLLAGFFAVLMIRRRGRGAWMQDRAQRLLIPLAATVVFVLPIQAMILGATEQGSVLAGLAQMRRDPRLWVAHSWFLRDLFLYCALLAIGWPWLRRVRWRAGGGIALLAVPVGFAAWKWGVNALTQEMLGRIDATAAYNLGTFLTYAPYFGLGAAIGAAPHLLERLGQARAWQIALALGWTLAVAWFLPRGDFDVGASGAVSAVTGLVGSWAILALMRRWFDRPNPLVDYLVAASLVFYLVHLPFVFLFTGIVRSLALSPTLAWVAVSLATLAACVACHAVVRRVPLAYFLLNGRHPQKPNVRPATVQLAG